MVWSRFLWQFIRPQCICRWLLNRMATEFVRVYVRVRPSSTAQCVALSGNCVKIDNDEFAFDGGFSPTTSQEEVFSTVAKKIIDGALDGINGTIFAYGQTGSGKTHTMTGPLSGDHVGESSRGLIPRSLHSLFASLDKTKEEKGDKFEHKVFISYVEIYNEKLKDLLSDEENPITIRTDKRIYLEGAAREAVTTPVDALRLLQKGLDRRHVAETAMNEQSSRSHSVFIIEIEACETSGGVSSLRQARICLVDLAGSERQQQANTSGDRLKEGCSINKSLTSLTRVIRQLAKGGQGHVSFRDSKLTLLLKDSLGGDSRTAVVVALHGGAEQKRETLSSLAFAENVKKVKNVTTAHKTITGSTVAALQQRVSELEKTLEKEQEEKRQERKEAARLRAQLEEQIEDLSTRTVKATPAKKKRRMTQHDHALISEIQGRLFDDDDAVCQESEETAKVEKENAELTTRYERLKTLEEENTELVNRVKEAEQKMESLQKTIGEVRGLLHEANTQISALKNNKSKLDKEIEVTLASHQATEELVQQLREQLKDKDARCEVLKTLEEENAELVNRVKEAEQKTESLQKTIGEVRDLLHEANTQISALEDNKRKLDKEIEVNLASHHATEELLQQLREELMEKETALRESEAERTKTSAELVKLVEAKTTRNRVSAMQKLKDENEALKQQINDFKKEIQKQRGAGR